jgi:acyl carrier protein
MPDIHGYNARCTALQEAIREAACGCTHIEAAKTRQVDLESVERGFELESTAPHVLRWRGNGKFAIERNQAARFPCGLSIYAHSAREQNASCFLAGFHEPALDEQLIQTSFFPIASCVSRAHDWIFVKAMTDPELKQRIKEVLVQSLMLKIGPEEIADDMELFSPAGLALDSIDALELAVAVEKQFGAPVPNAETAKRAFLNVNSLCEHIRTANPGFQG